MYKCEFRDKEGKELWRTIYAEDINQATRRANGRARKEGWVCITITEEMFRS